LTPVAIPGFDLSDSRSFLRRSSTNHVPRIIITRPSLLEYLLLPEILRDRKFAGIWPAIPQNK
jgi:hypothetical protein